MRPVISSNYITIRKQTCRKRPSGQGHTGLSGQRDTASIFWKSLIQLPRKSLCRRRTWKLRKNRPRSRMKQKKTRIESSFFYPLIRNVAWAQTQALICCPCTSRTSGSISPLSTCFASAIRAGIRSGDAGKAAWDG